MSTQSESPRRSMTKKEKRERDAKYRVGPKQLDIILRKLAQTYNALVALNVTVNQAGKGAYLAFPDPQNPEAYYVFNKKHLRSANAKFTKEIRNISRYFSASKKKAKGPVRPDTFKGTFTPVYAGEALRAFFTLSPQNFGPLGPGFVTYLNNLGEEQARKFLDNKVTDMNLAYQELLQAEKAFAEVPEPAALSDKKGAGKRKKKADDDEEESAEEIELRKYYDLRDDLYDAQDAYRKFTNILKASEGVEDLNVVIQNLQRNLMDYLPLAADGYLLRNTSTMLFYIYAHALGLQDERNAQYATSDDVMMQAFGGSIPADFYSFKTADNKSVKMGMADAVNTNVIDRPLNTYEIISRMYPDAPGATKVFRPERFNTYFYQNIAAVNYYSRTALLNSGDANLQTVGENLGREDIKQAMLDELFIVKSVSEEWRDILEPGRKQKREANKKARAQAQ